MKQLLLAALFLSAQVAQGQQLQSVHEFGTADVSVKSSVLPTGASTSAKQDTGNSSAASIDGKLTTLQTAIDLIKAKTDNLDVLLSTRTKAADIQSIGWGDSAAFDSVGRLRESSPYTVFESTLTQDIGAGSWETVSSGAGSGVAWNSAESTVTLTVGTGATDYVYRQTRYWPYSSGKPVNIKMTTVYGAGVTNAVRRMGQLDDNEGVFFQQEGVALSMCIRSSTSGTPVDTCVPQASWNVDKLDGSCLSNCAGTTNPSGLTLDITKAQLFAFDYIWQGVGRVRFGFQINGKLHYVHYANHANLFAVPYMATALLPLRYEIRNTAASAGAAMKQICVSVESEGGYQIPGIEFEAHIPLTARRAITTNTPVLAIRLATTYNGKANRKTVRMLHREISAKTNDATCVLTHVHNPTATAGGTWVAVDADSGVEYNLGLTSITATMQHPVDTAYALSGQGSTAGRVADALDWNNYHAFIAQNAAASQSQIFVDYCTSASGTADVAVAYSFMETKQ